METKKNEKPKYNLWQNSAYMLGRAWRQQRGVLWLCVALAFLSVASSVLGLFISPVILNAIETAVPVGELITLILFFAGAMMLVNAARAYASTNSLFGRIAVRTGIVADINEKISTTSYPNTESQNAQKKLDKANSAVNGNNGAGEAVWNTLTDLLTNTAGFVVYILMLSSLEPWVVAVVLATTITGFAVTRRINGWGYRHRDEEAGYSRRMFYITRKSADYTLAKDIRMFGMRGWLEDMYDGTIRLYRAFIGRGERVYIWGNIIDIVLNFARNGIAYIYLINLVLNEGLSASQFLLYFSAVGGFTAWVGGILNGFSTLQVQSLDLSAVREFLEYPEPFKFDEGEPLEPVAGKPYQIELRNVSFRYPEAEKDTLTGVNLTISPGEKLAVVGLNGAGKTTLVKLICGFIDPTGGEVLLNGINIKRYNRRDYYRHFSAVFQDFSLLAVTLAENIAQTDTGIDMERVAACADKAGLAKKIESLPQKYASHLGKNVFEDGIELSGGETQRLMLARALYKDAPVIVLDEPTAALDPIAESDMYSKYNELTGGRMAVYISHRLASTRFCDRIIYIEDGTIAEQGSHDALIARGGKYTELYAVQSKYYQEGAEF
jgi:ATP-binding cassette subfamily B protein